MKETKNTEAPDLVFRPKSVILTALHVLILVLAVIFHPPVQSGAVRVLP